LVPPLITVESVLSYKTRLEAVAPDVTYLMSLYLHASMTPEIIFEARKAGIYGVKAYPKGLTTNSELGVSDYAFFDPIFAAMEQTDLVLNLHGECPSSSDTTVLNAEEKFLPTLFEIHRKFPKLRIVLEHCTTAAAVNAVQKCGSTVVGTITAHHLYLTIDDVVASPLHYCKPVAKLPSDRKALLDAAFSKNPKFFLGSDSAPHIFSAKTSGKTAAGIFTQPYVTQLVLQAWIALHGSLDGSETLEGFLSRFGREFYGLRPSETTVTYSLASTYNIEQLLEGPPGSGISIAPFQPGMAVMVCEWQKTAA